MDDLTKLQADELIEQIAELQAQIKAAQDERDEFISHYESKIARAKELCEQQCINPRREIALLTEELKRFAADNLPEGRKSIALPSGKLTFRKQFPKYYMGGEEVSGKSKALLTYAKTNLPEYVKTRTEEFVDWASLKRHIETTGEFIEGLEVQEFPDAFTVEVG